MTRLFLTDLTINDEEFSLDEENSRYLSSVLRMKVGQNVDVVDSTGDVIRTEVSLIEKKSVSLRPINREKCNSEPPVDITLYQAVSKGERMDLTIQKSVELGVSRIVPVMSERCVVNLKGDTRSKTDRWQKIALEAARQSQRGVVPAVVTPMSFSEALKDSKENGTAFFLWEEEHALTLKSAMEKWQSEGKNGDRLGIIIGPEGGFSEAEAQEAKESGAICATIGKRILRTETAGPAVLAMMLYELEL